MIVRFSRGSLKKLRISVQLLSGDAAQTTRFIAHQADIAEFTAEVLPQDKIAAIQALQAEGAVVAMVGDGINDAPALARADLGIAMGSGTDIALQSAAVTILRDDLMLVGEILDISRRTIRTTAQNLGWAFLYNSIGLIIAAAGLLNPLMAATAMLASSLSVVGNSMRLREEKGKAVERLLEFLIPWREPA